MSRSSPKPKHYIGVDKPKVQVVVDKPLHWTEELELRKGNLPRPYPPREYGDNDPSDPEQAWV